MIAVSTDVQLQGLGRCWSTAVEHNNIYLQCPTTKSCHTFYVNSGFTTQVVGNYVNGVPVPIAKWDGDTLLFSTTAKEGITSYQQLGKATANGWSNSLALEATPTLCSQIVYMILHGKEKNDFYKVLADHDVSDIVINRLKSNDSYVITYRGEFVDLEHVLHVLMESECDKLGVSYTWNKDDYKDIIDNVQAFLKDNF